MAGPASASESATAPANPPFVIIVLLSAPGAFHGLPARGATHPHAAQLRNTARNLPDICRLQQEQRAKPQTGLFGFSKISFMRKAMTTRRHGRGARHMRDRAMQAT